MSTDNSKEQPMERDKNAECPSEDYTPGTPNGECWGDGHFKCMECIYYREDFKRLGQDFIDFAHTRQSGIILTTI